MGARLLHGFDLLILCQLFNRIGTPGPSPVGDRMGLAGRGDAASPFRPGPDLRKTGARAPKDPMQPELVPLVHLFAHGDRALAALVGDFTDQDWRVKDAAGHDSRWILGHLASVRMRIVGMLGGEAPTADWTAAFGRGSSAQDMPEQLDPAVLLEAFHGAQRLAAGLWERVDAERLAQPLGRTLPDGSDTIGGALRFLLWHEAYHLGQLGFMRRLVGKAGLA